MSGRLVILALAACGRIHFDDGDAGVGGGFVGDHRTYVKSSASSTGAQFGYSVALSGDGATLAVGAPGETADAGAAYVFTRTGGVWAQQAILRASNPGAGDRFGNTIALSGDGSTLAIAAWYEDSGATGVGGNQLDESVPDSGALYVFVRSDTTWSQEAYVKAANPGADDEFGNVEIALSASGDTLAIGAVFEDSATALDPTDNSVTNSGSVYVFQRVGTSWSQDGYLKAANPDVTDDLGESVCITPDGRTIAAGAYGESSAATTVDGNQLDNSAPGAGAVYIFTRGATEWTQTSYLKPSSISAGDHFGVRSCSFTDAGDTLAIGASNEDSASAGVDGDPTSEGVMDSGAAYLFRRSGGVWTQLHYMKAPAPGADDLFGFRVAIGGSTFIVAANHEDSAATGLDGDQSDDSAPNAGAAYVFKRVGASTAWTPGAYIKASSSGTDDEFGFATALSNDGLVLAVGAPNEDSGASGIDGAPDDSQPEAGAVYLYE